MEFDCELRQKIEDKINITLNKKITLFLLKNNENENFIIEHLIGELNLMSFEEDLYENYSTLLALKEEQSSQIMRDEVAWKNLAECDKCEEIWRKLGDSPFLSCELLNDMLKIQYIDTKQNYWHDISTSLRECLTLNYNLFLKSLKIHFKIISIQNTCCDGYLNLLKATNNIVKSNIIAINSGSENRSSNNRILLCIKIILGTQMFMLNYIHMSKDEIIEDIVENLIALLSVNTKFGEKNIFILDFVSFLNRKAEWLEYLCKSSYTKTVTFKMLERYPILLNLVLGNFLIPLNGNDCSDVLATTLYSHNCYFLVHFFSFHKNIELFKYKNDSVQEYTFPQLLSLIVSVVNNHSSPELKRKLVFLITATFEQNPYLVNLEILDILFTPFESISDDPIRIIRDNSYLFKIVGLVVKFNDKILTNGYLYNKKKYRQVLFMEKSRNEWTEDNENRNIPELIIDATILMLRNFINTSEKRQVVEDFVLILLECCGNIYNSHPVFLYNSVTSKFIPNLKNFCKVLGNFNSSNEASEKVLEIFKFFFKYHMNISKLLNDKIFSLGLFKSIISKSVEISDSIIFYNFSFEISMENDLQTQLYLIIQSFLMSAWYKSHVDQNYFVNILHVNEGLFEILSFVSGISHSQKLIRMLMYGCEDNILWKDIIPVHKILRVSVHNDQDTLQTYVGLLMIKILMMHMDGLVFLQSHLNLKENLRIRQSQIESYIENESEASNLNECSMVRKNILSYFESIGHPNRKLNDVNVSINTEISVSQRTRLLRILSEKKNFVCDLDKFLQKTKAAVHDSTWISQVKRLFQKCCSEDYKVSAVAEIINQFPKSSGKRTLLTWPDVEMWLPQLYAEERIGISIIVKFGLDNQLLKLCSRHEENLTLLIKQSHIFLNESFERFEGFDWFVGICFLICSGNIEKCKCFCVNMAHLPSGNLIWHKFGRTNDSFWLENFLQHIDVILAENTTIYTILKMAHLSPVMILNKWLSQCFFNILDFKEISNFIIFSIINPLECSVYYMMCLFMHNKKNISTLTHSSTLESLLNVICLEDFKIASYIPVINKYTTRYRNIIKL